MSLQNPTQSKFYTFVSTYVSNKENVPFLKIFDVESRLRILTMIVGSFFTFKSFDGLH